MLKHLGPIARKTLLEIFNCSWNKGLVPEVWKTTSCPSFKERKGQDQPKQLSPDQLIQLCCEAHGTCHHPLSHLVPGDQQRIQPLTDRVPGYRQHHSTEDQLALLTQDIENSFQEKQKLLVQWDPLIRSSLTVNPPYKKVKSLVPLKVLL